MHPETGRQSLIIGGHVYGIPDMTPEDSGQSLNGLADEACHGERAIEHTWTPWGVLFRHNSRLLHRVMPYDEKHETIVSLNCRNAVDPDEKRNSKQSCRKKRRDEALGAVAASRTLTHHFKQDIQEHIPMINLVLGSPFFQESRRTP